MYCIYLLRGAYIGLSLPLSAQSQVGGIWDVTSGPNSTPGSWGGHCVYVVAWNNTGPICITWGARQQMTWAFWDKYCDEAYGIVQDRASWLNPATDPVNVAILDQYLNDITQQPLPPISVYHSLNLAVSGQGSTNPAVGTYTYVSNSVITITAIPASGWQFVRWVGGVVDNPLSASAVINLSSDMTITAVFQQVTPPLKYHSLTISVVGSGTTNPPVGTYSFLENSVISVTAAPANGWQFVKWTGGVNKSKDASTTVIIGKRNKSIKANMKKKKKADDVTTTVIMDSDKSIGADFEQIPPTPPQPTCCDNFKNRVRGIWNLLKI